ncbi:hypothetical protein CJF31_00006547 [Rutstroemia sp. NJR-2017a BVV2]|nr:hypothetical protein CJF31_00006547 [Rutstroemia sp. NJR-2017a BVV2]
MSGHPADTEHKGDKGSFGDRISGTTIGVQNIEAAYARAGASAHHTPGAASKLGTQNQQGVNEGKGVSNPKNGADGKPQEVSSMLPFPFNCLFPVLMRMNIAVNDWIDG